MADTVKIITDHKFKHFKYRNEVPEKILKDYFDHLSEEEVMDGFIKYRNTWYHTSDFLRCEAMPGWDGFAGDSAFSGVAIKLSDDYESYKIATMIW